MKYWEIIADNFSKAGWSWAASQPRDSEMRAIWIAGRIVETASACLDHPRAAGLLKPHVDLDRCSDN